MPFRAKTDREKWGVGDERGTTEHFTLPAFIDKVRLFLLCYDQLLLIADIAYTYYGFMRALLLSSIIIKYHGV